MSENDDKSGQSPDSVHELREARIREIVDSVLERLNGGETVDAQRISDEHPDLAPALGQRLELILRVFDVRITPRPGQSPNEPQTGGHSPRHSSHGDAPTKEFDGNEHELAFRVQCPNCGVGIQVVEPVDDITCKVCGSTFHCSEKNHPSITSEIHHEQIARFQIKETLGRGGFGIVYLAFDPVLRRDVAIKVPRAGYFVSKDDERRFLREAQSAARLRHSGIVQVHEVVRNHGVPILVSEYIDGETLSDLISRRRLTFREAAELIASVSEAVGFANREGVVHRDIKPSNILIDKSGRPLLTDFGLARTDEAEFTLTFEGQVIGTPLYMSPEQAGGRRAHIDGRTDVYSLGVVLYRLLCAEMPFRGSKRVLLEQIEQVEPTPPRRVNEFVPPDLDTITLKAMAKEPIKRYQTADELSADLRRWLNNEPILARPAGTVERLYRWSKRNPRVALLSTLLALALTASCIIASSWAIRESHLYQQALKLLAREEAAHELAEDRALESRRHLADLYTAHGVELMDQGDFLGARLWFAESLPWIDDEVKVGIQRLRISALAEATPQLLRITTTESPIVQTVVSAGVPRLVARQETGALTVWNWETGVVEARMNASTKVTDVAISHNGAVVAAVDSTGAGLAWTITPTVQIVGELKHSGFIADVVISPDSALIATASFDNSAALWNAATGQLVHRLQHDRRVVKAEFSPQENLLLTISGDKASGFSVQFWDTKTGAAHESIVRYPPIESDENRFLWSASFSPDGKFIAVASEDGTAQVWNVATAEAATPPMSHPTSVTSASYSPDGLWIVTTCRDKQIRFWNSVDGTPISSLRQLPGLEARIASTGGLIATNTEAAVQLWTGTGDPLLRVVCDGSVNIASLDSTRSMLVTYSNQGTLRTWDVTKQARNAKSLPHDGRVVQAAYRPDGVQFATASKDGNVRLFNSSTHVVQHTLSHPAGVGHIAYSHDGQLLVSSCADKMIRIWSSNDGRQIGEPLTASDLVSCLSCSPNNRTMLAGCVGGVIRSWDLDSRTMNYELRHEGRVQRIAFSPDGKSFATGCSDRTARVWNTDTGQPKTPSLGHDSDVTYCDLSPNGELMATTCTSGDVQVWSTKTGSRLAVARIHKSNAWSCDFSPDGKQLLTTGLDGRIVVSNVDDLTPVAAAKSASSLWALGGSFHSSGSLFVSFHGEDSLSSRHGLHRGEVRVWDSSTGLPISPPLRHSATVVGAVWNLTGDALLSTSYDHTAKVWPMQSDKSPMETIMRQAVLNAGRTVDRVSGLKELSAMEFKKALATLPLAAAKPAASATSAR